MRKYISSVLAIFLLSGCTSLSNFRELVLLKNFSQEQDQLDEHVDHLEEKFEELVNEFKTGTIADYVDKQSIYQQYGEPIFIKFVSVEGRDMEMWMYRNPVKFLDTDKAYLYFDLHGQLISYNLSKG